MRRQRRNRPTWYRWLRVPCLSYSGKTMGEVMMIDDSVSQSANYVYCCLTVGRFFVCDIKFYTAKRSELGYSGDTKVAFIILRTGHLLGLTVNDSYLFAGFELADQNSSMAQLTVNICLYSHCLISSTFPPRPSPLLQLQRFVAVLVPAYIASIRNSPSRSLITLLSQ